MSRFQTIEDVRTFCRSVAQLAIDLGDEEIGLMLRKALAAGDTSSPIERLGETILGLEAARKFMDDRYPVDVLAELDEAVRLGWEGIRRANGTWNEVSERTMSRFRTVEDVRAFCISVANVAAELGDEKLSLMLGDALAVGNTQSPTERLWYTIVGLAAAVEVMDDRYSDDLIAEINEAVELGREWITRANGPW